MPEIPGARTGDEPLVIREATVADVAAGTLTESQTLVIADGVIQEVGASPTLPSGAREVSAGGRVVIPGLVDAHVHVLAGTADLFRQAEESPFYVGAQGSQIMRSMLARGFTTVRDVGGADHGVSRAVAEGLWEGPRVVFGGRALSPTGGHGDGRAPSRFSTDDTCCDIGLVCDGEPEVRRAARHQLRTGAHHVKVMLSGGVASPTDRVDSLQFSDAEISAVVDEAQAANRYVAGHAYTARAVNRGLRLGVRSIEHGNLIDDESVELFRAHDAYLVPTLVTYDRLKAEGAAAGLPRASQEKVDVVLEAGLRALERAWRGGVNIVFGTDLLGAMHPHQSAEFRIRAEVMPARDVLLSATVTAARLLGMEGQLGVIAPGAAADLLVVDGDPLEDAAVLADPSRHLRTVVHAGRVVSSSLP
ncbi:amidohydrolase family protein [Nesterenkonia sp. HG001]|uniref:metal-dependent hydrolase family protein n=1 Tax=Nesterenkonia sp. HG001 TaxID=2983207 RepID=UPI002AC3DEEF|nr:amidohydrolase family protein [Nesterenkonia sp. HG001]MDZ5077356.1 amidohydrolase family protein [Nesterenkonia sp. HG001]